MRFVEFNEMSLIDQPLVDDFSDTDDDCDSCWTIVNGPEPEFVKYIEHIPRRCDLHKPYKIPFLFHWRQLIVLLIVALVEMSSEDYGFYQQYAVPIVVVVAPVPTSPDAATNHTMHILRLTLPTDLNASISTDHNNGMVVAQTVQDANFSVVWDNAVLVAVNTARRAHTALVAVQLDATALVQLKQCALVAVDTVVCTVVDGVLYVLDQLDSTTEEAEGSDQARGTLVWKVLFVVVAIVVGVHFQIKYT